MFPPRRRLAALRSAGFLVTSLLLAGTVACASDDAAQQGADTATETAAPSTPAAPSDPGTVWKENPKSQPTPAAWSSIKDILDDGVTTATQDYGADLSWCAIALDIKDTPQVCVGSDRTSYSASLPKVAIGVAAVEAFDGDLDEEVSGYSPYADHAAGLQVSVDEAMGRTTPAEVIERAEEAEAEETPTTVGDLIYSAIKFSDNDAYNELVDLISERPVTKNRTTFAYINSISERIDADLAENFHVGNYMNFIVGSDWNHLTASGASEYLAALVAAADGDVADDKLDTVRPGQLTTPRAARTVLEAMYDQTRTTKIPADLPSSAVANKTGETDTESHDMAVLGTKSGRIALVAVSTFPSGAYPPDEEMGATARKVVQALGGPERL